VRRAAEQALARPHPHAGPSRHSAPDAPRLPRRVHHPREAHRPHYVAPRTVTQMFATLLWVVALLFLTSVSARFLALAADTLSTAVANRIEAEEAACRSCPLREQCLQTPETRRKHLAVLIGKVKETLAQQMSAKIDTPEAREIYGQRLAIVEPVFGNLRSPKRLDHFTLRGKIKVNIQWMLSCIVHNMEKILHYGGAVEKWGQGGLQTA